jgi:hypothetical protein
MVALITALRLHLAVARDTLGPVRESLHLPPKVIKLEYSVNSLCDHIFQQGDDLIRRAQAAWTDRATLMSEDINTKLPAWDTFKNSLSADAQLEVRTAIVGCPHWPLVQAHSVELDNAIKLMKNLNNAGQGPLVSGSSLKTFQNARLFACESVAIGFLICSWESSIRNEANIHQRKKKIEELKTAVRERSCVIPEDYDELFKAAALKTFQVTVDDEGPAAAADGAAAHGDSAGGGKPVKRRRQAR